MFSEDGTYLGHRGVSTDITASVDAERALTEADLRKDEFLATLGHELRNPLAAILPALEVMRCGQPYKIESARDVVERQIERMIQLVDDLLDISRIAQGKIAQRGTPQEARRRWQSARRRGPARSTDGGFTFPVHRKRTGTTKEGLAMRRTRRYSIAILALMLCAFGVDAFACSCMRMTACEAFARADAVFIGSVRSSSAVKSSNESDAFSQVAYRFSIEQTFFGVESQEVEVLTGRGGGDCGYVFRSSISYLIYAYRDSTTGKFSTSSCTRTRPLGEADEDLGYIRAAIKEKPGVTISGQVQRYYPDRREQQRGPALAGQTIIVAGKDHEYRAVTNNEGKYVVPDLPAGKYEVRLELDDGLWTRTPKQEVSVSQRGCAEVGFLVETDGRIAGKVVDGAGNGLTPVHLMALRIDAHDPLMTDYQEYASTEASGEFLFRGLPPGRYVFRITHAQSQLYKFAYYPNVQATTQAFAVEVGEGRKVDPIELRLAPPAREFLLPGVVVWPDGKPAAGIEVRFGIPNENFHPSTKTDSEGRFTARLFAGFTFWINAEVKDARGVWHTSGERPPIEPTEGMEPLRLVLKPQTQ